jgi:hypothetical protein
MTTPPDDPLEHLVRSSLRRRAADAPHRPDLAEVQGRAAQRGRRRRRRLLAAGLTSTALVLASAAFVWVGTGSSTPTPTAGTIVSPPRPPARGPMTGSLVLPLTGAVEAAALQLSRPAGDGSQGAIATLAPRSDHKSLGGVFSTDGAGAVVPNDQTIDVPPGTGQTLDRLATRVSPDGVIVSTFFTPTPPPPAGGPTFRGPPSGGGVGPAQAGSPANRKRGPAPADSCAPTGEVTIEISDTQAVATFTEGFYGGYTTPLVDVEIGELGVTEGSPATWVEAQVGPAVEHVVVHFADGGTDSAVPAGGVAVLAHLGDASTALGNGSQAFLEALGAGGTVLARYALGVAAAPARAATPPSTVLPAAGTRQPAGPAAARTAVGQALAVALSCSEPPVAQSQAVSGGGAFEELGGAGSSGLASGDRLVVDKVVFTSPSSAAVRFQVEEPGVSRPQVLYADATLVHGAWLLSLASVAPGLQLTAANGDGDVAVAPGGPIFVHSSGGVAIAVYRAARSSPAGNGCSFETCSGEPPPSGCLPTGGVVEEVTTAGAVAMVAAPLFGSYTTPLIGVGMSIVGEAEGSPATVLDVETGPGADAVRLTTHAGTGTVTPVDGVADSVLAGAPATAIGPAGGTLTIDGASGTVLATVPLQVDSSEPATASTLPSSLPPPGSGTAPADPAAATTAIEQLFSTVFGCADTPFVRAGEIEDNGLFANPIEQLYLGPYASLVESVYATVEDVVFVSPTVADVSYTIRFHNDASLQFPMLGTAVLLDGAWRVSYATLCRAVALGGVECSS